jgi:hypothetical protein
MLHSSQRYDNFVEERGRHHHQQLAATEPDEMAATTIISWLIK